MLSKDEKRYLKSIPEDKVFRFHEHDSNLVDIAENIIEEINEKYTDLSIQHLGSSALGIGGQNDIDIYILSSTINFSNYLPWLKQKYGNPKVESEKNIEWEYEEGEIPITIYLTDSGSESMQRQLSVQQALSFDTALLKTYEELKRKYDGKNMREYQEAKYNFYHEILD